MVSDLTQHRRAFWAYFAEQLPELYARTERGNETTRWLTVGRVPLIAAHYISANGVGMFVRGARGTKIGHVREYLFPHRDFLAKALRREQLRLGTNFLVGNSLRVDMQDRANWPRATNWLAEQSPLYERALKALQRRPARDPFL